MKFVKVLLSLYSVQLIIISALLMTYLAIMDTNRPNKTGTGHGSAPITDKESARVTVADAQSLSGKIGIKAVTSQTTALEIDSESRMSLETASVSGKIDNMSNTERVAEGWGNKDGFPVDQLLFDPLPTRLER